MIRVAVSGAGGRMGGLVADTVAAADDMVLAACYDPTAAGDAGGVAVSGDPETVAGADVVVEFSVPDAVLGNLARWRAAGVHAVVGTSGFDDEKVAEARSVWGSGPPNCLIVPNFSIGAVLMMRFAAGAAPHFAASEIIELHHDHKADAPSGTALATAGGMKAAGGRQDRAVESAELAAGARGASAEGVPVHSVRLPGLMAHQEVLFGAPGETLTIRHDTLDRTAFMPGVLLAVRSVAGLPDPVTVGLDTLLGP